MSSLDTGGTVTVDPRTEHRLRAEVLMPLVRRAVYAAPPALLRAAGAVGRRRAALVPFGVFERDTGASLTLLDGYRDLIKSRWRAGWWPTEALLRLRRRAALTPALAELASELDAARTLPFPLREVADALTDAAPEYPGLVEPTGRRDARLGLDVLEAIPAPGELDSAAAAYRLAALAIERAAASVNVSLVRSRVLDVGCGSGSLSFALAGAGAGEVVGIDLDIEGYCGPTERATMAGLLAGSRSNLARLEVGDVRALECDDASFDVVCSITALEHIADVGAALREMHRVLRPGGLAFHGVDPWFGPRGGHGLCTVDAPWGHVRLSADEFARYAREVRPHEADDAIAYRRGGFQRRPLSIRELRNLCRATGFELRSLRTTPLGLHEVHRRLLDRGVLDECRSSHPQAGPGDLLVYGYTLVVRRR